MLEIIIEELINWRRMSIISHCNSYEKEQYYKKCYELFGYLDWDINKIKPFEEKIGISALVIRKYAQIYALEYLKMTKEEYKNHRLNSKLNYLEETNLLEKNQLESVVRENDKNIFTINHYMNLFIESSFVLEQTFCHEENITIDFFQKVIKNCKKYNPSLYEKYLQEKEKKFNEATLEVIPFARKLAIVIKEGIQEESGVTRPFDIIDYFLLINIDSNTLYKMITNQVTLEELKIIKQFFQANLAAFRIKTLEIERIKSGRIKVGYPITVENSSKKELYYPNNTEIEDVISIMKQLSIPLNEHNYSVTLKRYLTNTLPLHENHPTRRLYL